MPIWLRKLQAQRTLRKQNICPVHFTPLVLVNGSKVCTLCKQIKDAQTAADYAAARKAAVEYLKGHK